MNLLFPITFLLLLLRSTFIYTINITNVVNKLIPLIPFDWQNLSLNRKEAVSSKHPLRHERWELEIESSTVDLPKKLVLHFYEKGTVKARDSKIAGEWKHGPYGIIFHLKSPSGEVYHFSAELCWNNYGESAFFRKGVVYSDRKGAFKYLFRKVHGKFSGSSIRNK